MMSLASTGAATEAIVAAAPTHASARSPRASFLDFLHRVPRADSKDRIDFSLMTSKRQQNCASIASVYLEGANLRQRHPTGRHSKNIDNFAGALHAAGMH